LHQEKEAFVKKVSTVLVATLFLCVSVFAMDAKTYQVTGTAVAVTDNYVEVQKGKEKWEIARDASTKVMGGMIMVGDKVTVTYTMTASKIEVKSEKGMKK
jgi:hypothetical protein